MSNLSTVHIAGNMATAPEYRVNKDGSELTTFRVAVNHRYQNKQGIWEDGQATYITVNCWGRMAGHVKDTGFKGMAVIVIGRLFESTWETKPTDGSAPQKRSQMQIRATHVGPDLNLNSARLMETRPHSKQDQDAFDQVEGRMHESGEAPSVSPNTGHSMSFADASPADGQSENYNSAEGGEERPDHQLVGAKAGFKPTF